MSHYILGVAGGSGSGKTFFAETLAKRLGPKHSFVLYQDSYYHDQSARFDHDGGSVNFDHPESLDFDLLATHLQMLKEGHDIEIPIYDFATHQRLKKTITQKNKQVIIVDGILILTQPKIRALLDESIFVKTPEDIRFQRRLSRDVLERGRTAEGVKKQFEAQVKPMHDLFVEPSQEHATIISSGTDIETFQSVLQGIIKKLNL
ncbi:MAG: uridine kinase [Halobacteriovoraceae bacterium]|nr:uridine kinase [Halobacteriovoraceae bacterium]